MCPISRSMVLLASVLLITALIPIFGCPSPIQGQSNLTSRVEALETALDKTQADLAAAQAKLAFMSVQQGTINGLKGPHLIIEGCNVHIRSGSGDTSDSAGLTGLGNLIIGYNELPNTTVYGRQGSHNLVLGKGQEYSSYGGLLAGEDNAVSGPAASVCGGEENKASGHWAAVSGGSNNQATGDWSSISGGGASQATGNYASVSGGGYCEASGNFSSVSGGYLRSATAGYQWAAGSLSNAG